MQTRFTTIRCTAEEAEAIKNEGNEFYKKKNAEFEIDNDKLSKEITATVQKIDINNLLKEVDIEDLRLLAQNNKMMTSALHGMLSKWENIQKVE